MPFWCKVLRSSTLFKFFNRTQPPRSLCIPTEMLASNIPYLCKDAGADRVVMPQVSNVGLGAALDATYLRDKQLFTAK